MQSRLVYFGFCLISLFGIVSCSEPPVPSKELLVDARSFPEGWVASPCYRCDYPSEAWQTITLPETSGDVAQEVYFFNNEEAASAKLRRYFETDIPRGHRRLPSIESLPPPQINVVSPYAEEQFILCGVDGNPRCTAGFRYGSYFVYFRFDIDQWLWFEGYSGLSLDDIPSILEEMDKTAAQKLGLSVPDVHRTPNLLSQPTLPFSPTPPTDLEHLLVALADSDPRARIGAAEVLTTQGEFPTPELVVPLLTNNLAYNEPLYYENTVIVSTATVQIATIRALATYGTKAQSALPALVNLLQSIDDDPFCEECRRVREEVIIALGDLGDPSIVPMLALALNDDSDLLVNEAAAMAISKLTGEIFPTIGPNNDIWNDEGIPWVVESARNWWNQDGQYQEWESE